MKQYVYAVIKNEYNGGILAIVDTLAQAKKFASGKDLSKLANDDTVMKNIVLINNQYIIEKVLA